MLFRMAFFVIPVVLRRWYEWLVAFLFSTSVMGTARMATEEPADAQHSALDRSVDVHEANLALLETLSKPSGRRPAIPTEMVLQIIDHPSRWRLVSANVASCTLSEPKTISSYAGSEDIASTAPLTARQVSMLRRVAFTFRSRDQGWSSYPDDHGTFRNSWTWFEARVQRPAEYDTDGSRQSGNDGGETLEPHKLSYRLQANRHAMSEPEEYRIELGPSDDLLGALQSGDRVILSAHAQFGGWVNHVDQAAIEMWCVDTLDDGNEVLR